MSSFPYIPMGRVVAELGIPRLSGDDSPVLQPLMPGWVATLSINPEKHFIMGTPRFVHALLVKGCGAEVAVFTACCDVELALDVVVTEWQLQAVVDSLDTAEAALNDALLTIQHRLVEATCPGQSTLKLARWHLSQSEPYIDLLVEHDSKVETLKGKPHTVPVPTALRRRQGPRRAVRQEAQAA